MALEWVTLEGYIGCIDKGEDASKLSVYAECSEDDGHNVKYTLITTTQTNNLIFANNVANDLEFVNGLPLGLSVNTNGSFSGICRVSSDIIKNYVFTIRATAYDKITNEEIEYIDGNFYITTNKPTIIEEIIWDNDNEYTKTFKCGDNVDIIIKSKCKSGNEITYSFENINDYPKGLHLTADGRLYGAILPQETKSYMFNIKASTKYTSSTKTFTINVVNGLGQNAVKCYMKLNHTNDDWYDDLRSRLNINKSYNTYNDKYSINDFPQIEVANLHCFDRELLSWLSGVRSENIETMARVTVNPFPSNAKITITCDGYEQEVIKGIKQNYIIVPINSTIHWKAEYGDNVKEGDAIAVNHLTLNIALVE